MALFDYDPPTMSPNPEACDEELPFREGQLIKVCIFLLIRAFKIRTVLNIFCPEFTLLLYLCVRMERLV